MKAYTLEDIKKAINSCPKFKVDLPANESCDGLHEVSIETIETKMFLHKLSGTNFIKKTCHCGNDIDYSNPDCVQFSLCKEHQMDA